MTTKADIVTLLAVNDKAVARALVALNKRQTQDEQAHETTKYANGMGFRPCDAARGTGMAQFYTARGYLTPKQIAFWRKREKNGKMKIAVYAGQLLLVAEEKAQKTLVHQQPLQV
jgi:hypothetical protein